MRFAGKTAVITGGGSGIGAAVARRIASEGGEVALPPLIARGDNIVELASIAGLFAGPDAVGYVTMKHACIGLAKSLDRDYGRKGVRTNTVCPGWVTTPMADEKMDYVMKKHGLSSREEAYALVTKDVPLGKPATPEDVANAVTFLASS
jgi:meso-butanediol dehydrogenase/(S,S)-butanediol dehydrogenase/diacetyl reductase